MHRIVLNTMGTPPWVAQVTCAEAHDPCPVMEARHEVVERWLSGGLPDGDFDFEVTFHEDDTLTIETYEEHQS